MHAALVSQRPEESEALRRAQALIGGLSDSAAPEEPGWFTVSSPLAGSENGVFQEQARVSVRFNLGPVPSHL